MYLFQMLFQMIFPTKDPIVRRFRVTVGSIAAAANAIGVGRVNDVTVNAFLGAWLVHPLGRANPLTQDKVDVFFVPSPVSKTDKVSLTESALVWSLLVRLLGILAGAHTKSSLPPLL